jgi:hypothetical protein
MIRTRCFLNGRYPNLFVYRYVDSQACKMGRKPKQFAFIIFHIAEVVQSPVVTPDSTAWAAARRAIGTR